MNTDIRAMKSEPEGSMETAIRIVFVTNVANRLDLSLLRKWLTAQAGASAQTVEVINPDSDEGGAELAALESYEQPCRIQPVGVVWRALESHEAPSLIKDLFYGRRIHPGPLRRRWLARHRPDRIAYVSGDGLMLDQARRQWCEQVAAGDIHLSFANYLAHHCRLSLEQAERQLRGARYRIARELPAVIFANRYFSGQLERIAGQLARPLGSVRRRAGRYLSEMAATQTPFTLDILMAVYRLGVRSNHDPRIDVLPEQVEQLRSLLGRQAVTFQITHKSMLDTIAFSLVMFDANLPVPLTFGGINLKTFGIGALARRAGIIFVRRSFQDNELYKAVLRRYIDHLIERRFSVLWALEGGRSRTGKLLPPRYGLFSYVLESSLRTSNDGLYYVPVAVAYDQITEVDDYAREQRGNDKKSEGMGWMLRFFKRAGSHGRIYVRFGDAFQLADIGFDTGNLSGTSTDGDGAARSLTPDMQLELVRKLAFESANRLNRAMPVTVPAILTLILLASGRRAQRLEEIQRLARAGAALLRRRRVEIVGLADFRKAETIRVGLNQLRKTRVVNYFDDGLERLYRIEPAQQHVAAYYRNTVIHHVLLDAVIEVALIECGNAEPSVAVETFYQATEQLRELFLFEFFFPPRASFRDAIATTMSSKTSDWESVLQHEGADALLRRCSPLFSHGVLRSFVDAYRVVSAFLVRAEFETVTHEGSTMTNVMKLGRQMLLQEIIFSSESVSRSLFDTAFRAADARGLLSPGEGETYSSRTLPVMRQEWHRQLTRLSKCLDRIMIMNLARGADDFN